MSLLSHADRIRGSHHLLTLTDLKLLARYSPIVFTSIDLASPPLAAIPRLLQHFTFSCLVERLAATLLAPPSATKHLHSRYMDSFSLISIA